MLTDFGFACQENKQGDDSLEIGTLPFEAPEIIKSEPRSYKVDIWAAGCIAYYLLSGCQYPFDSEAEDEEEYKSEIK